MGLRVTHGPAVTNVRRQAGSLADNGDIEGRGSWTNATCGTEPKARVLCQDHVRESTRSMSGSSLNLGSTSEAWCGTPDVT